MKTIEYWLVENGSWCDGISWFDDGHRYASCDEASRKAHNLKNASNDQGIKWRVTRVCTTFNYLEI